MKPFDFDLMNLNSTLDEENMLKSTVLAHLEVHVSPEASIETPPLLVAPPCLHIIEGRGTTKNSGTKMPP